MFLNNIYPIGLNQGIYWMSFVANLFWYYVIVMIPSVYFYQRKNYRNLVLFYLNFLIFSSIGYLFIMTFIYNFSTLLTTDIENMFDELFRYPFGPVGYYAMGIMLSIFYFEYQ